MPTPEQIEKRRYTREWRRKGKGVWHLFLGDSDVSECLNVYRPDDEPELEGGGRKNGVRKATPPAHQRVCSRCADSIGLARRSKRAATSKLSVLRRRYLDVTEAVGQELTMLMQVTPALIRSARAAVSELECSYAPGPECEDRPYCRKCEARHALKQAVEDYAFRTAEIDD